MTSGGLSAGGGAMSQPPAGPATSGAATDAPHLDAQLREAHQYYRDRNYVAALQVCQSVRPVLFMRGDSDFFLSFLSFLPTPCC